MAFRHFLTALFALAIFPITGAAAQFSVNTTEDLRDSTPGDGICRTDSANCSLRAAIQEANALSGADSILVPAGTYVLSLAGDDDTAFGGDLDITESLSVSGDSQLTTIIDGNGMFRIFDVLGDSTIATFSDLNMQHGVASTPGGAGILNRNDGMVTVEECTIMSNIASSGFGGGVNNDANGSFFIRNSLIQGNFASGFGGGVTNDLTGDLEISGSTISGNYARGFGGGINNNNAGVMTITSSLIEGNSSEDFGGGVNNNFTGSLTISNSTISGNSAAVDGTGRGGGLNNNSSGTTSLTDVEVIGNSSFEHSGGVHNNSTGSLTGHRVAVLYNSSTTSAGGVMNNSSGSISLTNSSIIGNSSQTGPGGVENRIGGSIDLVHTTVVGNHSNTIAGGISKLADTITLTNSIVAHNFSGVIPEEDNCDGIPTTTGVNIESADTCGFGGSNLKDTNPLLGFPQKNGGATTNMRPLPGSPVIDAASTAQCESVDQRNVDRPVDGDDNGSALCDIGSVEYIPDCFNGDISDDNENGIFDCRVNAEFHGIIAVLIGLIDNLKKKNKDDATTAFESLQDFYSEFGSLLTSVGGVDLDPPFQKAERQVRKALKLRGSKKKRRRKKKRASRALTDLDEVVE